MIRTYVRNLIKYNDALSVMIHEFNVWPTRYAHPSWYDGIGDFGQLKELMRSERVEKKIAALILDKINNEFFYDFSKTTQAIGLLDPSGIEQLLWYSGLAVYCKHIRHYGNQGEDTNGVRQAIGESAFHFAMCQAPLLVGSMQFDFLEEIGDRTFDDAIMAYGRILLGLTLSDHPSAITSRIKLKFKKSLHWDFNDFGQDKQVRNAQILMRKILLQEVMPSWKGLLS